VPAESAGAVEAQPAQAEPEDAAESAGAVEAQPAQAEPEDAAEPAEPQPDAVPDAADGSAEQPSIAAE
jgi:hypothetical protein